MFAAGPGLAAGEHGRTKWGSQPWQRGLMMSVLEMDVILERQGGRFVTRHHPCSIAVQIVRGRVLRVTAGIPGAADWGCACVSRRVSRC